MNSNRIYLYSLWDKQANYNKSLFLQIYNVRTICLSDAHSYKTFGQSNLKFSKKNRFIRLKHGAILVSNIGIGNLWKENFDFLSFPLPSYLLRVNCVRLVQKGNCTMTNGFLKLSGVWRCKEMNKIRKINKKDNKVSPIRCSGLTLNWWAGTTAKIFVEHKIRGFLYVHVDELGERILRKTLPKSVQMSCIYQSFIDKENNYHLYHSISFSTLDIQIQILAHFLALAPHNIHFQTV